MGQTCHTGGTWGGVDSPPTGLLCCLKVVGEQSAPGGYCTVYAIYYKNILNTIYYINRGSTAHLIISYRDSIYEIIYPYGVKQLIILGI